MTEPKAILGIAADGTVDTVALLSTEAVMDCLQHGLAVVPCSLDRARVSWGQKLDPLALLREQQE